MKRNLSTGRVLTAVAVAGLADIVGAVVWEKAPSTALAAKGGKGAMAPKFDVVIDTADFIPQYNPLLAPEVSPAEGQNLGSAWTVKQVSTDRLTLSNFDGTDSEIDLRGGVVWLIVGQGKFVAWDFTSTRDEQGFNYRTNLENPIINPIDVPLAGDEVNLVINANVPVYRVTKGRKTEENPAGYMSLGTLRWTMP